MDDNQIPEPEIRQPKEDFPELPAKAQNWELNLGIKWFSRAGIVALLIGFAMALNYSFPLWKSLLTPEVKIIIGWLFSFGLFFGGQKLHIKFQLLGRILQGGGLSLGYLTLYGMFFIPNIQLFTDQSIGWALLFLYVGAMIGIAQKMQASSVAILSLAFGYYTATYSGSQLTALVSTSLLSIAAIILSRYQANWGHIAKVGCGGFLLTFIYWHWFPHFTPVDYISGLPSYLIGNFQDENLYLLLNFLIFHLASFLPVVQGKPGYSSLGFNLANTFGVYALYHLTDGDLMFGDRGLFELLIASLYLGSSAILLTLKTETDDSYFTQASILLTTLFAGLASLAFFNADVLPVVIAGMALSLGLLSKQGRYATLYRTLSYVGLGFSYLSLLCFDWNYVPDQVLLMTVGAVAIAGLILEHSVYGKTEPVFKIALMLFSSLIFLVALMIGLQSYWVTVAFVLTSFCLMMSGFMTQEKKYRLMGLCWLFMALFRLVTVDLLTLETPYKILLFLVLGVTLLIGSFAYNLLSRKLMVTAKAGPDNHDSRPVEPGQES